MTQAQHGAVHFQGALVCCEHFDREPCPHDPARRCDGCPGGSTKAATTQSHAQPVAEPTTPSDARALSHALMAGADDPMWADHAEVNKATLRRAAEALRFMAGQVETMAALMEAQHAAQPVAQEPANIPGLAADPSAFVRWAEPAGYDMTSHPLHFLFLNEKTAAARDGWNACRRHYEAIAAPVARGIGTRARTACDGG